jgi:hypothetical protein
VASSGLWKRESRIRPPPPFRQAVGGWILGTEGFVARCLAELAEWLGLSRADMEAGTASYGVFLNGRKAIYFGRNGDFHVEPFPGAR